jgi:hypothetical protein
MSKVEMFSKCGHILRWIGLSEKILKEEKPSICLKMTH